ncbi:MAG: nucleotide exchange factor GrpE [Planctomycetes bacterium B3_Pla]|nr:MAG: nucleotide exchange factor GrpE [Planctomycetes bacterium B3_Pla]
MGKKLAITASLLLIAGVSALGWALAEDRKDEREAALYKLKYSDRTAEYQKQYDKWLLLPPQERAQLPLLLDEDGNPKSRTQLQREEQERLRADMAELAAGEITASPFSDVLYGDNWQQHVVEYRKQKGQRRQVFIGSAVCTLMGGLIYIWWLLLCMVRIIFKGSSGSKQLSAGGLEELKHVKTRKQQVPGRGKSPQSKPKAKKQLSGDGEDEKHRKLPVATAAAKVVKAEAEQIKKISDEADKIAVMISDEKAAALKDSTKSKEPQEEGSSEQLDNTLSALSEQVTAIREYTSHQQDRLEKLQDGYDWNIIRTFCLRVIRCIDNLDGRINRLNGDGDSAVHLEEVRDELIFALESSGIEQYKPEINSEYRGQEKYAEAIKEKQSSDDPKQAGRIADVIRPGYQYFINEGNVKVVRTAQVKLFA